MGVIFDSSEIVALERNRETARVLIAGRPPSPVSFMKSVPLSELLATLRWANRRL